MKTFSTVFIVLIVSLLMTHISAAQVITTIAGNGVAGRTGDGGPATAATLNVPTGLAFDKDGNLLITDQENYAIRKLDLTTGIITRIAGNYNSGHYGDGGLATNASIYGPSGIGVDKAGNIYVAEQYGSTVRKIDVNTGIITTVIGKAGNFGYSGDGGLAVNAIMDRPLDVEIDASDNIYFTDWENNVIRRVDAVTNIITTVAGRMPGFSGYAGDGGLATNALLNAPSRIYFDPAGNLYIADQLNNIIRKVDMATGIINRVIGMQAGGYAGDGGAAINAGLKQPAGLKMDADGNIYIADTHNHAIRFVNAATGIITTIAGTGVSGYSGDGGPPANATFFRPTEVLPDGQGNLYIADARNHVIRKISLCPKVSLGVDTAICRSEFIELNAGNRFTSFRWNTGAATQTIQVDKPGIYWVEGQNGSCAASDTITIAQHPVQVFNWQRDPVICEGSSIVLPAPANAASIQWQDGSSANSYTITQPGKYWAAVVDQHNCKATDTLVIEKMIQAPADFLLNDTTFCSFDLVTLQPTTAFAAYHWSTGNTTAITQVDKAGAYWLEVQDQYNCKWKETIVVTTKECERYIKFPNAFTPNNDRKNDVFKPAIKGRLNHYKMTIYNRWGQKVFETNDLHAGWNGTINGTPQGSGTYAWFITYQLPGERPKIEKGTVMLLR